MFLIFCLGRPDVLPIHDLGVKKGWSITYGKKHMPTPKELLAFGERWRPYRTLASWYMWRAFDRAGYKATNKISQSHSPQKKSQAPGKNERQKEKSPTQSACEVPLNTAANARFSIMPRLVPITAWT